MRALLRNPLWRRANRTRARQKLFGRLSGLCLALALIALFDGLFAQMRTGHEEFNLLPGENITVSGPAALKNPLASDVIARFHPENAPLRFELEGFFTGYWFGSGMWRGQIQALPDAPEGRYDLRLSFRGASAQSAQHYVLKIYPDARAMQLAARSLIHRYFGLNPFLLAAGAGGLGLLLGCATYFFGRKFMRELHALGLVQIYSGNAGEIQCSAPKKLVPPIGNDRMVLAPDGSVVGEARVLSWQKGKLKMRLLDAQTVPPDALVCLRHPWSPEERGKVETFINIHKGSN